MPTIYRNSTLTRFDWRQRKIQLGCGLSRSHSITHRRKQRKRRQAKAVVALSTLLPTAWLRLSLLLIWATWPTSAADNAGPFAGTSTANSKGALKRPEPFVDGRFRLERGDVVAFLGGSDVSAAQHAGHLEALLAVKYCGLDVDFRNFGWEAIRCLHRRATWVFPH